MMSMYRVEALAVKDAGIGYGAQITSPMASVALSDVGRKDDALFELGRARRDAVSLFNERIKRMSASLLRPPALVFENVGVKALVTSSNDSIPCHPKP
jgi:hypothetical protein|mmetsp:Transcript_32778/g.82622  ORF Transcript_32778/g.82622 Transcript_32778/m.82622 type:complete len:98 (-) Transcript_32778:24-317(-)